MSINQKIVADFINNKIEFVTTVPCKQLAGVINEIDATKSIYHIPSNKEDEGMGLCTGAMGGKRSAIILQNTAIGVTINTLVTLIQYYNIPLPMLISYRRDLASQSPVRWKWQSIPRRWRAVEHPDLSFSSPNDVRELDRSNTTWAKNLLPF